MNDNCKSIKEFSYSELSKSESKRLRAIANQIFQLNTRLPRELILAGGMFAEAKSMLSHGSFCPWCELEFTWNASVIRRMLAVHLFFADHIAQSERFSLESLYLLSSSKIASEARKSLINRATKGEQITPKKVRELIGEDRSQKKIEQKKHEDEPTVQHSLWETISGLISDGGTLILAVSPDKEQGDAIVSAHVHADSGARRTVTRSSVDTAILAVAGKENLKFCTVCQHAKPAEGFAKKGEFERAAACKACERRRVKEWKRKRRAAKAEKEAD